MKHSGMKDHVQLAVPAKHNPMYSRRFARTCWRQSFVDDSERLPFVKMIPAWHGLRQAGLVGSFRHFTGRTVNN